MSDTDQKSDKTIVQLTAKELKALIKEAILEASRDKEKLRRQEVSIQPITPLGWKQEDFDAVAHGKPAEPKKADKEAPRTVIGGVFHNSRFG